MIEQFDPSILKALYVPPQASHKGQNGKLMIIGGSHLFHAASLWALQVASRIVDMVFYSSVPENNEIVQKAKEEFRNGIVVRRDDIESYIQEADCVLIGPGMVRTDKFQIPNSKFQINSNSLSLQTINGLIDEGEQTYYLTKYLLKEFSNKKWVIDAGSLQMMEAKWLKQLQGNVIVTPHQREFETLFQLNSQNANLKTTSENVKSKEGIVSKMAKDYNCIILLKGQEDIVCSPKECVVIPGGNAGMTKGGTGDVLAGLVAALACKNEMFLAALAGSFINKKAGEALCETMGFYFNASDLATQIPQVMKQLILS